jgi:hypothetical protein
MFLIMACTGLAFAWEESGVILGTEIEFSGMNVSREGVGVRLTNVSGSDIKVSLRVEFLSRDGNVLGYSLIGLRTILAGAYAEISGNHLSGNWRECKNAPRMKWRRMTYEFVVPD